MTARASSCSVQPSRYKSLLTRVRCKFSSWLRHGVRYARFIGRWLPLLSQIGSAGTMLSFPRCGRQLTRIGALVLVASAAAGCGTSWPRLPHTPTGSATTAAISAPSSLLKDGQSATVEFNAGEIPGASPAYKLRITVIEISEGGASTDGGVPYYLRYRIRNLGRDLPDAAAGLLAPEVKTADGTVGLAECLGAGCAARSSPCPQTLPSQPFPHGKTQNSCATYYLPSPPLGVVYGSGDSAYVTASVN